jgi:hypothetical protein
MIAADENQTGVYKETKHQISPDGKIELKNPISPEQAMQNLLLYCKMGKEEWLKKIVSSTVLSCNQHH